MKSKKLLFFASMFLATTFLSGCGLDKSSERYEVTFKNYDQTVLYSNTVEYDGTAEYQGPVPERPSNGEIAYYFTGWDRPLTNIRKDTTFIAQYDTTPNTIEITWNNYNGLLLTTSTVMYGQIPTYVGNLPEKPSDDKFTYEFTGWSPEIVPATKPSTYTAVFESHVKEEDDKILNLTIFYTVYNPKTGEAVSTSPTIPSGLGDVSKSKVCQKGGDIDLFANPNEGYTFLGWYYDDHLISSQGDYLFRSWDSDVSLEARFQFTMYNLVIYSSNSSFGSVAINSSNYYTQTSQRMYYTEEVTLYSCSYQDIRFIGWYNEVNELQSNNAVYTFKMPNRYYEITAKWNKFFITYDLNGGSVNQNLLVYDYSYESPDDRYIDLPTPSKLGYNFLYWQLNNGTSVSELDKAALCDYYVRAIWEPISYTIEYRGNGSTYGSTDYQYAVYDEYYYFETCYFSKTGYSFVHWNTRADDSGTTYEAGSMFYNLTTTDGTTIVLYAIWKANTYKAKLHWGGSTSYTLSFETNGADQTVYSQTITETNGAVFPGALTKSGYSFKGWYKNSACTELFDFSKTIGANTTVYAGWESMNVSNYNYRYYVDASQYTSSSYAYATSVSYVSSSYPDYYYFTALTDETISFKCRTSSSSSSYYVYYSIVNATTGITVLSNRYVSTTSYTTNTIEIAAGNVYYIKVYNYNTSYSPTFSFYFEDYSKPADGGSTLHNVEVKYDSNYTLPTDTVTRNGYTFGGWYDKYDRQYTDKNGKSVAKWTDAKDVDLYAKWNIVTYSITYNLNGGTNSDDNPTSYTVEDVIALKDAKKDGYTFGGWFLESTFETQVTVISYGNYYRDLTLYAKWVAKQYSVTLDFNGGNVSAFTISFDTNGGNETYSSQIITPSNPLQYPGKPTKSGYVFKGWYKDQSCTQLFDFSKTVSSNMTAYAGWESMATSGYYSRVDINPSSYYSSSYYYSRTLYSSSGNYDYHYFTANKTETASLHYRTSSTSSGYRIYMHVFNVTTGSTIYSNSYISNSSYNSLSLGLTAGNVYCIRTYRYNTSYNPTFYFYFTGYSSPATGGQFDSTITALSAKATYNESFTLPTNVEREGYKFLGWFDENDVQYTDEYGNSLFKWKDLEDVTLYAHWELIS